MIRVFLLEDRAIISDIIDSLEMTGFTVCPCKNIYEADEQWDNQGSEGRFDAIVVDLMMSTDGLDENDKKRTREGMYTGWVWLWSKLTAERAAPNFADGRCIVIYSAYTDYFDDYINQLCSDSDERKFLTSGIKIIEKGDLSKDGELIKALSERAGIIPPD
jgi:CheY-like chemotaxis protein